MPMLGGGGALHHTVTRNGRKGEGMKSKLSQRGSGLMIMLISPLLTLAMGGVGWASLCNPHPSQFFELDGNAGFNSTPGFSFDWANAGANSSSCSVTTNGISCATPEGVFNDSSGCTA